MFCGKTRIEMSLKSYNVTNYSAVFFQKVA